MDTAVRLIDARNGALPLPVARSAASAFARLCFPAGFLIVDSAVLIAVATVAHWPPGAADENHWHGFLPGTSFVYPLIFGVMSLISLHFFGFYDRLRSTLRNSEMIDFYGALALATIATMAATLLLNKEASPSVYITTLLVAPLALVAGRGLLRWLRRQIHPTSTLNVPVLMLGDDEESDRLLRRIESVPEFDLCPIQADGNGETANVPDLRLYVQRHGIQHIIIAPSIQDQSFIAETAAFCNEHGLRVAWLQRTTDLPMAVSSLHTWDGTPVIHLSEPIGQRFYEYGKRTIDLACVLLALPVALPLLLVIAVAVKLDSPGPALIGQRRVGRGGRTFDMYKFRSMRCVDEQIPEYLHALNEATGPMFKMRRDPRITRVGRVIRRVSFDELPQILNVLRGDMTLVGPRPPLPREIPGYDEMQRRRLMVKPGITGLWQVSGRSNLTFEEMLKLDVSYIQKRSLLLDMIILVKTVPCVLGGRGAY